MQLVSGSMLALNDVLTSVKYFQLMEVTTGASSVKIFESLIAQLVKYWAVQCYDSSPLAPR